MVPVRGQWMEAGGVGRGEGMAEGWDRGGDVVRNLSNCRACEAVLA